MMIGGILLEFAIAALAAWFAETRAKYYPNAFRYLAGMAFGCGIGIFFMALQMPPK